MGKTVAILSGKGGTGKTAVTALLGTAWAMQGKNVLCVDMDFGLRGLEMALGIRETIFYHLLDVCEGRVQKQEGILSHPEYPNLKFLPAPQTKTWEDLDESSLQKFLEEAKEEYDWILLDGPSGTGRGAKICAGLSQEIVFVSLLEPACLRGADKMSTLCGGWGQTKQSLILNRIPCGIPAGYEEGEWRDLVSPEVIGFLPEEEKIREQFEKGEGLCAIETNSLSICKKIAAYMEEPYEKRQMVEIPRPDTKENKRGNSFIQKIYEALSNKKL